MTINSRSTKPQLLAHITTLDAELRSANMVVANLRMELSIAKATPAQPAQPEVRKPFVPRERNSSLPAHFVAAREAAMRMGKSVKVVA